MREATGTELDLARADVAEQDGLAHVSTLGAGSDLAFTLLKYIREGRNYSWTSLPIETRQDKMNMLRFNSEKENGIESIIYPQVFTVRDVILAPVSFADVDGKQVITPKLTLINPEGQAVQILAKVWIGEFLSLFAFLGKPTWLEPVVVSAKQAKGHGTNRYYTMYIP